VEQIKFEVPVVLPGSLSEIVDEVIARTVKQAGTQLRAAFYLGVTPQMISGRLNHRRKKLGRLGKEEFNVKRDPLKEGTQ
jgi:hypothetical protein